MSILGTVRSTILSAFVAMPLLLISFVGFLAIGLGNLGLFILFMGHALAVPALTELLHVIFGTAGSLRVANDISQLVPRMPTNGAAWSGVVNIMPSYWMAHISFFFGYLLMNAISIYRLPADKKSADWLVESRVTRAATTIATTVVLVVVLSVVRYFATGTETLAGIVLAILALGGLGMGWYELAAACGARNADVFGVAQQMIPQSRSNEKPMTCVYSPRPS